MTLSLVDIQAAVNDNLNRADTNLDRHVKEVLIEISARGDFLIQRGTIAVVPNTTDYSLPSGVKTFIRIYSDSDRTLKEKNPSWVRGMLNEDSATTGEPDYWSWERDKIYIFPKPTSPETLNYEAYKLHAYSTTVEYDDRFNKAIVAGVTASVANKYSLNDEFAKWNAVYENEIAQLMKQRFSSITQTQYRDI